jgi:peroxiredoxin
VELQQTEPQLRAKGAQVVAVTTDTIQVSQTVARHLSLDYPILADEPGGLGAAFGVYQTSGHMGSTDAHAIFVLDQSGKIRWSQLSPSMHVPMEQVLTAVTAIQ